MASVQRRGGIGCGWGDFSASRGRFNELHDESTVKGFTAADLVTTDGMSRRTKEHMERVIASSELDRRRAMRSYEEREHVERLHYAARMGEMETCKKLVELLKFDVDSIAADGSGLTPLACAVSHGKTAAVKYFLDKGANINKQDCKGFAPLHYAAKKGNQIMVCLLVSRGASVDLSSSKGTPLHVAASYGKSGILQMLLEHRANPNIVSADLLTPVAAVLYATPEKVVESVCLKCLKLLCEAGADLNSTNPDTPLVIATRKGLTDCVTYLLEAGADANIPIKHDGKKPIEIAAKNGEQKLVELLFPSTSPIEAVSDWSVEGIITHAKSRPLKDHDTTSCESRKDQLKLLGREAVGQLDYVGASKFYTKAIDLDPTDAKMYSNRSYCHLQLGEAEYALCDANSCIRLLPEWQKGYYRKGAAHLLLKEYKAASDAFMDGLRLDPSSVEMENAYRKASEAMSEDVAI